MRPVKTLLFLALSKLTSSPLASASANLTRQQAHAQIARSQARMASSGNVDPSKLNVLGSQLEQHGKPDLPTGWFRDNYCRPDDNDPGDHTLAGIVTKDFLLFSKARGNDLMTQGPKLSEGCRWCLCVSRWREAFDAYKRGDQPASAVPYVNLKGTSLTALGGGRGKVTLEELKEFEERKLA